MKNYLLKFTTVILFGLSLLISVSVKKSGHLTFFNEASAKGQGGLKEYTVICSDGKTYISTCGVGDSDCTPSGVC